MSSKVCIFAWLSYLINTKISFLYKLNYRERIFGGKTQGLLEMTMRQLLDMAKWQKRLPV